MIVFCAGCSSGIYGSLGSLESSRGTTRSIAGNYEHTSSWEALREASKPYWARGKSRVQEHSPALGSGEASGKVTEKVTEKGGKRGGTQPGSPDEMLVIVDREHGLPSDYIPKDLVFLHPLGIKTLGGGTMKLRKGAAEAASRMLKEGRGDGIELVVSSAYRSHEDQAVSYGRLTLMYGDGAGRLSAPPGHSEHQLGTAIDLSNNSTDYRLVQGFAKTKASRWLREKAAEYGFVLSYPREAEDSTGYHWEPWHYRYIGRKNAREYEAGDYRSPQQFFLERGVLPHE